MSLMIAPATGPSMVSGSDHGGSDSADGGDQFAEVLAGRTSAADDAPGPVSGAGKRTGRDGADAGSAAPADGDAQSAQGAAMLALAGTVVALNPLRPVVTVSSGPGSAVATGVTAIASTAGAVAAGTVTGAAQPTGNAPAGAEPAAETTGSITGTAAALAGVAGPASTPTPSGETPTVAGAVAVSGKPALPATVPTAGANVSVANVSVADAQATNTAQQAGGAASPLPTDSASTASTATAAQLAAVQAVTQATTQPAGLPAQNAPAKPGTPESLGAVAAAASAHPAAKADTKDDSGKQDGHRDGRSPSDQAEFTLTDTGRTATPVAPAAPSSPTVAGLGVANSLAPNPQLTSTPQAATPTPAGQTQHYPSVPQPLAHQLARPVLDVRASGDGSHQLSISLHPAELGPVNLHVKILGDVMTIQLASTSESAHDAIRAALPQLRHELQSAGLAGVDVSLDFNAGSSADSGGTADPRNSRGAEPGTLGLPTVLSSIPVIANRPSGQANSGLDRWL